MISKKMNFQKYTRRVPLAVMLLALGVFAAVLTTSACNQEAQNHFSRSLQNWTGTNGILEVYAGEKLVKRFMGIDKLTTARATAKSKTDRPYRFGYGYLDADPSGYIEKGEKKVYFEFSDYSTSYIFYEAPRSIRAKKKR